jgi:hypothetical protein
VGILLTGIQWGERAGKIVEAVKESFDQIGELVGTLEMLDGMCAEDTQANTEWLISIVRLCSRMVDLLVKCLKYIGEPRFRRATDAFVGDRANDIESAQKHLKRAITTYNTATITMNTLMDTRDDSISRYRQAVKELRNRDPLNPDSAHGDIVGHRVAGTGKWVTDSNIFKTWLASTAKHHSLWCLGEREFSYLCCF